MTKEADMPDDLYACYLLYMDESKKRICEVLSSERRRAFYLSRHKPVSRRRFHRMLKEMTPEGRASFEKRMRTPYAQIIEEVERAIEKASHEYDTDPAVRARVAWEAEAALAKAMALAKRKSGKENP